MPDRSGSREATQYRGPLTLAFNGKGGRGRRRDSLSALFWALLPIIVSAVCLAIGAGGWTQVVADFFGRREPSWIAEDFVSFYSAGRMLASGLGPDLLRVEVIGAVERNVAGHPVGGSGILPYFHPPFVALAFAPLTRLSLARAYQVWTVVNLVVLGANCWLLWLLADAIPVRWRIVVIVAYVTLAPVAYGLRLGQVSLILQASVGAGYLALVRGRDRLAGGAFAILLIKPELLLFISLILAWKRRWSVLAILAPAGVLAVGASVAAVGPATAMSYPDYVLDTTSHDTYGVTASIMFNWLGIVSLAVGSASALLRARVAAALSLLTVLSVALVWRGAYRPQCSRFAFQWLALVLATALADPHLYLQDTVIVVPALVAAAAAWATGAHSPSPSDWEAVVTLSTAVSP